MTSKGISVHNEEDEEPREEEAIERKSISSPKSELERHVNGEKKKKNERFKLHEEDGNGEESNNGYSKGGGVSIRVVVTQRELIQISSNESKYSSVGQLLSTMKLKSRKICQLASAQSLSSQTSSE
ncbi:hypothetical protein HYC85_011311 [Camellia sinensis]|uniref:Uncharacterized protein n=1 Tax=Camellia sinensis TaxID=4442 RepID=A0A7J7HBV9_CAMSI|nr:hypothetical protein HYC85_011311 [Camellia sinensis]